MTGADLYRYRVGVVRVVDGDTFIANIDAGFRVWLQDVSVRVLGVNCPEPRGPTRDAGLAAEVRTAELLGFVKMVYLHSEEYDSFGRVLAWVWLPDGRRLDEVLIAEGHGLPASRMELRL